MREYLSLDIGFNNIKLLVGKAAGSKLVIKKAVCFGTPENTIEDGKIIEVELLAQKIGEQLKENKIKTRDTIITINSTSIISREVIMPKAKEKEIRNIIDMESEQYFPVSLENYRVDFKVIEELEIEGKSQYKVLIVAVPAIVVERYVELAKLCNLNLTKIDYSGNSVTKLMRCEYARKAGKRGKSDSEAKTIAVVDIGARTTTVTIVSKGILQFSRIIFCGGSSITNTIADRLNIMYDEAERSKIKLKKIVDTGDEDFTDEQTLGISNSIKSVALILIDDIIKYFEFYNSRTSGNKIDHIYLTGGTSNIHGLDLYLGSAFNITTSKLKALNRVKHKDRKLAEATDIKYYTVCLGALLD